MEVQETSDSDPHQGKLQKNLAFCTHPYVRGFRGQTRVYTQERVKSRIWQFLHVFRDDIGNIKGK